MQITGKTDATLFLNCTDVQNVHKYDVHMHKSPVPIQRLLCVHAIVGFGRPSVHTLTQWHTARRSLVAIIIINATRFAQTERNSVVCFEYDDRRPGIAPE